MTINKTKRLTYLWEKNRLESFKTWPFDEKSTCNIKKLSEAGFFWTGSSKNPDSAQCFLCEKQLDGWEAEDDPWDEHKKHSPNCLFAKLGKKEKDLQYRQMYNIFDAMIETMIKKRTEYHIKLVTSRYEKEREAIEEKIKEIENS